MKKLVCGLTLCLSVGNIFAGSTKDIYKKNWIDFNKNGVKDVYEDPAAPIEARVADLLSQMTLEEKTCQMATLYGSGIERCMAHCRMVKGNLERRYREY
jgi:beta-glucosidase